MSSRVAHASHMGLDGVCIRQVDNANIESLSLGRG